jgi:hypothetical protein
VDEPTLTEETEALEASAPSGDRGRDQRIILGNTGQNVLGLAIGALATFAAQVIMTNRLGDVGFGVVTLTTQFAFIAAAATRFGMDVANVRLVAILVGRGQAARSRGLVRRSALIATAVSVPFAVLALVVAPWLAETFSGEPVAAEPAFRAAAVTVPVAALAFTYMGATRGLKIMRFTLYAQWIAQPIGWIVLTLAMWTAISSTAWVASAAFGVSWALALCIAWYGWEKEQGRFPEAALGDGIAEEHTGALLRFGALRAPATLFSQLIFWTDFVLDLVERRGRRWRRGDRRLRGRAAGGSVLVPVPHERLPHVQPVRRGPAPPRRARAARRPLQAGDAVDARRDDPRAAGARGDAGVRAAGLRPGVRRGRGRAADPDRRDDVPVMVARSASS